MRITNKLRAVKAMKIARIYNMTYSSTARPDVIIRSPRGPYAAWLRKDRR